MIRQFLFTVFFVFLSVLSLPMITTASTCGDSSCTNAPQGAQSFFTIEAAKKVYASGTNPTWPDLARDPWSLIGDVAVPGFENVDSDYQDRYDNINGLLNTDGSRVQLVFNGDTDFSGAQINKSVTLWSLGVAGANQGPNVVNLTSSGACFAQFGYKTVEIFSDVDTNPADSHFNYQCRIAQVTHLICELFSVLGNESQLVGIKVYRQGLE